MVEAGHLRVWAVAVFLAVILLPSACSDGDDDAGAGEGNAGAGGGNAATTCPAGGVDVDPGADVAAVAADPANGAGTTYCIKDGNYTVTQAIEVQSNDRFLGIYGDGTRPIVTGSGARTIFDASVSDSAEISGLQVQGAVGSEACAPDCGRGIGGAGTNLHVHDVRATHNANQGIGGTGDGLLVTDSTLDDNGYDATFTGETDGPVSAAGVKSVNSMVVRDSVIRDNRWNGIWCDIDCTRFEVHDSTITGNGKAGVHDEISSGPAVVEGNVIRNNGDLVAAGSARAGLLVVNSKNLDAYGNTFGSNAAYAFWATFDEPRYDAAPGGDGGFRLHDIDVHHNDLNGDATGNQGLPDSRVDFHDNTG